MYEFITHDGFLSFTSRLGNCPSIAFATVRYVRPVAKTFRDVAFSNRMSHRISFVPFRGHGGRTLGLGEADSRRGD